MADEQVPTSSEQITPPADAAAAMGQDITPCKAANSVPPVLVNGTSPENGSNPFYKSMGQLAIGWMLALAVFALCVYLLFDLFLALSVRAYLAGLAALVATFVVFAVLERKLVLSRIFGLQTGPHSSPLLAVISWIMPFGIGAELRRPASPNHTLPGRMTLPESAQAKAPGGRTAQAPAHEPKDVVREVAETVVFVVVLVLLLKTFVAEAFVIPTGSMATTLWGYQKYVTCPECGESFPVNCSSEVDPQSGREAVFIDGCVCPNCRYPIEFVKEWNRDQWPDYHTGDRVLVAKFIYDTDLRPPRRDDVVVFKYPVNPQQNHVAMNYIKRLVGLGRETIAIHCGKLYVTDSLDYSWREPPPGGSSAPEARERPYTYESDEKALKLFEESLGHPDLTGRFQIIRKAPDTVLAMSRLVYDNDHQARDLAGNPDMQRWVPDKSAGAWKPDNTRDPRRFDHSGEMGWLRYRHVLRDAPGRPQLITDFMGYNTGYNVARGRPSLSQNWVSDLILECDLEVASVNSGDEVVLELAKGPDRFQARFNTESGDCTLVRHRTVGQVFDKVLGTKTGTRLKGTGKYHVRLANVDERLTLWVDSDLPFGDGVAYEPAKDSGPNKTNDLQPAAIGVKGNAAIAKLQLRRDTYYTVDPSSADVPLPPDPNNPTLEPWANPDAWGPLHKRPVKTIYVQPTHYLCLGDNSPESADGRSWGLVPQRLLLGRALMVYFPFYPFGPVTRVGPIK